MDIATIERALSSHAIDRQTKANSEMMTRRRTVKRYCVVIARNNRSDYSLHAPRTAPDVVPVASDGLTVRVRGLSQ